VPDRSIDFGLAPQQLLVMIKRLAHTTRDAQGANHETAIWNKTAHACPIARDNGGSLSAHYEIRIAS
jgi:hypothetical protein